MEKNDHIRILFDKYLKNRISEEELKQLLSYFEVDDNRVVLTMLINEELAREPANEIEPDLIDEIDARLQKKIFISTRPASKIRKLLPAISVAATILLGLSFISIMYIMRANKDATKSGQYVNDVKPGSSKAILTLANGNTINLSGAKNGTIAQQSGVNISKTAAGQLIYSGNAATSNTQFNTIETPKGGEYQVVLPDGSHVWLNAASSLKYPISFNGAEREVELTGEAYFEVAHDKAKPFRVISGGQSIEVLGTHFNIMAYGEENAIKTTLLEGSVKVIKGSGSQIIKPGEQAVVTEHISIQKADVEEAVAWKNGRTYFKDADIPTLMRSLSRWYDVSVEYQGTIPDRIFTGGIPRKSNLSTMMKILGEMNIHAHIEGRKIIVTP